MSRCEFSKPTKRQALERSQMRCEAVGEVYGLQAGIRCSISLAKGVQFDHIVADAIGGDNSLENCASVCPRCHQIKTAKNDVPKAAKVKRVSDKAMGIKTKSHGFPARDPKPKTLTKIVPRVTGLYQRNDA